jgi:hypothetical protein
MKVTIQKHKQYLTTEINPDTELIKIFNWMDKEWHAIYLPWLEDKSKNKLTEDGITWKWLVTMFNKLPDGKKTKAFIYQTMVLNNIVNDGINGKEHCWYREHGCNIKACWIKKLNRDWETSDVQNICGNLAICIRLPDPKFFPFNLDFPENLKEVVVDDRILNIRR